MRAAILAIGDEIVLGQTVDTNSAWLSEALFARSVVVVEHRAVGDDRAAIAEAVRALAARSDILILTGGLGPTDDDLTRDALGDVLAPGRPLVTDERAVRALRHWFGAREMPASNLAQAKRPETMQLVPNPCGTAPGLAGRHEGCLIFAMPGPPREMEPMFLDHVVPALGAPGERDRVAFESVHLYGIGESRAAEMLGGLTARDHRPLVGITASGGIITARVRAEGAAAIACMGEIVGRIEAAWAPYAFGRGAATLARALGAILESSGQTLVTAESCTGGWLGKAIVDEAGASAYYLGGWVTYSGERKVDDLGVPRDLLERHGAVSAPVARAMAEGARRRGESDFALSVTGIAGPDGGTPEKPLGTVFVALAGAGPTLVRRFHFRAARALVRDRSVKSALQMLRFALIGASSELPLLWEERRETP